MRELLKDLYGKLSSYLEANVNAYSEIGKNHAYEQIKDAISSTYYSVYGSNIDDEIDFIIDVQNTDELDSLLYELACKANDEGRQYAYLMSTFDRYFDVLFPDLSKEIDNILEDAKMIQNDVEGEQYQKEMDEYVISLLERIKKVIGEENE